MYTGFHNFSFFSLKLYEKNSIISLQVLIIFLTIGVTMATLQALKTTFFCRIFFMSKISLLTLFFLITEY